MYHIHIRIYIYVPHTHAYRIQYILLSYSISGASIIDESLVEEVRASEIIRVSVLYSEQKTKIYEKCQT